VLTLGQIPTPKETTTAASWPFVPLTTSDDITRHGRTLNLTCGKARVMASQLDAAGDQVDR
jgi:hypothetical protein